MTRQIRKPQSWKNSAKPKINFRDLLRLFFSYLLIAVQRILFFIPRKYNRIMLYVYRRKGFTCNPKYIARELLKRYGSEVELIWVSMYPETCDEVRRLGIPVVKASSLKEIMLYLRTTVYITDDSVPVWAAHHNHIWINTWHGAMNYKNIGYEYLQPMNWVNWKLFLLRNRQPDYFLAGSRFFAEDTISSFFLDPGIFLDYGLPRNDDLVNDTVDKKAIFKKLKDQFDVQDNKHLVMFAPTFRNSQQSETYGLDFKLCLNTLSQRFGGEWMMLFRDHAFVKNPHSDEDLVIDVSAYEDMQELLAVCDVLISDYSSCMYDFCLQKKPCFVFAPDMSDYMKNERSFAYPVKKWPYMIAKTNEELMNNIYNYEEVDFCGRLIEHYTDTGTYDQGNACKNIADLIESICGLHKLSA